MLKKIFLYILVVFVSFISYDAQAQYDEKHYVPPFYGRTNVDKHYLVLSTLESGPVSVTVRHGDGTFISSHVVTQASPVTYQLGSGYNAPGMIRTSELNTVLTQDGLIVEGDGPFFCNIRHVQSAQGLSLTSKGAGTAPGTAFRTGHIHTNTNMKHVKAHVISVMATEDNTVVNFSDFKNGVLLEGQASTGGTTDDFSIVLDSNESYVVAALPSNTGSTNNFNGLNGALVTSDRPIVVSTGSWLSGAQGNGRDIGMDQIVGYNRIGRQYIFTQGDGNNQTERPLVVATVDNTQIYVNGAATPVATLNAGDYVYLPRSSYSGNRNIYVEGTENFYMYQSMSGPNTASTGLNFIPPLRCNGATEVIVPNVTLVGGATVSIIARIGSDVFINGSTTPLAGAQTVPGNNCWKTYEIDNASGNYYVQSDSVMNVALVNKRGVRGAGGFFSGFSRFVEVDRGDTATFVVCSEETESYVVYSMEGPFQTYEYNWDNPATDSYLTQTGSGQDTVYYTYTRGSSVTGNEAVDVKVCKIIGCCGAEPDSVCEVSRMVFNNIDLDPVGAGDSLAVCIDTASIDLFDLINGSFTPGGTWGDLGNSGLLFGDSFNTSISSPGTYKFSYVVQTNQFCSDSSVVTVHVKDLTESGCCRVAPTFTIQDPTCFGLTDGSVQVVDTYANEFSTDGVTFNPSSFLSNLGDGTVTVYSRYGQCVDTSDVTITEPDSLYFTETLVDASCYQACDGSIDMVAVGGTAPFTYSLNGSSPVSTTSFPNLCDGNYTVDIFDANNCTNSGYFTINEPTQLRLALTSYTDEACGQSNGIIAVSASGGNGGYTFSASGINNGTDSVFTGLSANTYTVTVTDSRGCTASLVQDILDQPGPSPFTDVVNNVLCAGTFGSAIIGVNQGTAPFTFALNGGTPQSSNAINLLLAGNHTVEVTDANGCTGSVNFDVLEPASLDVQNVITDETCPGSCDAQIDFTVTGGTGNYTLNYGLANEGPFASNYTISNLCAGLYDIQVSDENNCLNTFQLQVQGPDPITVTGGGVIVDATCHDIHDGSLDASATGGTAPLEYSLDGGPFQSASLFTGLGANDYDITIRDARMCQKDTTIEVEEPEDFGILIDAVTPTTCGATGGQIDVSVEGTGGVPNYSWEMLGGSTFNNEPAGVSFTNLAPGVYTLALEDANGCQDSIFVGVADNSLTVDISVVSIIHVDCYGLCNGSMEIEATGGQPPYTYALNTGALSSQTVYPNLCAEDYVTVAEDANGCISTFNVRITEPDEIEFDLDVTDLTCHDDASGEVDFLNITGGEGAYYTSFDNGAFTGATNYNGQDAGTYDVAVRDDNNCTITDQIIIEEPDSVGLFAFGRNLTCEANNTGEVSINGFGGTGTLVYNITPPGTGYTTTTLYSSLAANTYNVSVMDDNLCEYNEDITITEPAALTSALTPTHISCYGLSDGEIAITAGGGTTPYGYSSDSTYWSNTANLTGLVAGTYDIFVRDSNNCYVKETIALTQPDSLEMTINLVASACNPVDGEIHIVGNGGTAAYEYQITQDGGAPSGFGAVGDFLGLAPDDYTVEIRDANGCITQELSIVDEVARPVIDSVVTSAPLCAGLNDGQIEVFISGGTPSFTYDRNSGDVQVDNGLYTNLSPGVQNIDIVDANGCALNTSTTFATPTPISLVSTVTEPNCNGENNGVLDLVASGGTAAYQYSINGGTDYYGVSNFNGLTAGTYDVRVLDVYNCAYQESIIILEPAALAFTSIDNVDPSCFDYCDGSIAVNVTGGVVATDYIYNWSTGNATDSEANLCADDYSIVVVDDQGCVLDSINHTLAEPAFAAIDSVTTVDVLCFGDSNAVLTVHAANAGLYSLDGGAFGGASVFNNLPTGFYWVRTQDANSCPGDSLEVYIGTPQPFDIFIEPGFQICPGDSVYMNLYYSGGVPPYAGFYNDDPTSTTEEFSFWPTQDTSLWAQGTDGNGCIAFSDTSIVTITPPLFVDAGSDTTICEDGTVIFFAEPIGGVEDHYFEWSTGESDAIIQHTLGSQDSVFTVKITDECGQEAFDTVWAFVDGRLDLIFDLSQASGCAPGEGLIVKPADASGTGGDCSWSVSGADSLIGICDSLVAWIENPGVYDLTYAYNTAYGCTYDTSLTSAIEVFANPVATFNFIKDEVSELYPLVNTVNLSTNYNGSLWVVEGDTVSSDQDLSYLMDAYQPGAHYDVCLEVMNGQGCVDMTCDSVYIKQEYTVFVANAFKPDFEENPFMPYMNFTNADNYYFAVFNRWGELMFESYSPGEGWDGTYKGQIVQSGVYVWRLIASPGDSTEKREFNGHVTIVR